jgi:glycosyltransferase involved in cell wall biosynthesis
MPAVSVIMPAYNVEPYIDASIGSVRRQTHTDLELVIVDDGSTDATYAIARRHADADRRIRLVHQDNGGLSAARNTALRHSRAPLIAMLDSDDLWTPTFLDKQLAVFEADPSIDVVTGNGWVLGGTLDGTPARPYPDPRPQPDLVSILADELSVFVMSVFRRRVSDVIGNFDESLRTNEDYDFWLRAAIAGFRFARNDMPLGYYRRRDDSLSADDMRMLRGIIRVYTKHRPTLLYNRPALDILDLQIKRFEAELIAFEAKHAMETRDFTSAKERIAELNDRRGGAKLGLATMMSRWTPGLLWRAYQMRRNRRQSPASAPGR